MKSRDSFTLVEVLIVMGVLSALATAVVLVINPAEMLRGGRDSTRLNDLTTLDRMMGMLEADIPGFALGSSSVIYVSIPDSSPTCSNLGLLPLPPTWSYRCSSSTNLRMTDGTGWIPVDFTQFSAGSPLAALPVDPVNSTSTRNFYLYTPSGSWHFATALEAARNQMGGSTDKTASDKGSLPSFFEIGNNLTLLPVDYGDSSLVAYLKFDEGSGTTVYDYSGRNNTSTLFSSPSWATGCHKAGCVLFNGTSNYGIIGVTSSLNMTQGGYGERVV